MNKSMIDLLDRGDEVCLNGTFFYKLDSLDYYVCIHTCNKNMVVLTRTELEYTIDNHIKYATILAKNMCDWVKG